jgi:hypothetical protein
VVMRDGLADHWGEILGLEVTKSMRPGATSQLAKNPHYTQNPRPGILVGVLSVRRGRSLQTVIARGKGS